MKKFFATLVVVLATAQFVDAQWSGGPTGPIHYSGGNVGIGTTSPGTHKLEVSGDSGYNAGYFLGANSSNNSFGLTVQAGTTSSDIAMQVLNRSLGSPYFMVRGDGNVGIGTTSPQTRLDVPNLVRIGGVAAASIIAPTTGASMEQFYDSTNDYAQIQSFSRTSSVHKPLRLDGSVILLNSASSGNVGIGTTNPLSKLQVNGNSYVTGGVNNGHSGNGYPLLGYNVDYKSTDNTYHYLGTDLSWALDFGNFTGGNSKFRLRYAPYNTAGSVINYLDLLTIDGDGKTTFNNNVTLTKSINGELAHTVINDNTGAGAYALSQITNGTSGLQMFQFGTGFTTTGMYIQNGTLLNSTGVGGLSLNSLNGVTRFFTGGNERMRIDESGNVGVGTTDSKGYKLAVNGSAVATSMTVKLYGSWPDYVFKSTYKLPSLADLKTFIDQNQHLPEMPSEKEVAENGINLGEIVKLQTKKIEELTLYLIEKDLQLKKQQSEITELKEQRKEIDDLKAQMAKLLK